MITEFGPWVWTTNDDEKVDQYLINMSTGGTIKFYGRDGGTTWVLAAWLPHASGNHTLGIYDTEADASEALSQVGSKLGAINLCD